MWLDDSIASMGKIVPMEVVSRTTGWCCIKHELEFDPDVLELVTIQVGLSWYHQPEVTLKAVYKLLVQAAKQSGQHSIVHLKASPSELVVALRKLPRETTGRLNVEL